MLFLLFNRIFEKWRRPVRRGTADRARGSNFLAVARRGVAGGDVGSDGEDGNATATTPDSCIVVGYSLKILTVIETYLRF